MMCEYCKRSCPFPGDSEIEVKVRKNRLEMEIDGEDAGSIEIRYCPMCGMKLRDPNEKVLGELNVGDSFMLYGKTFTVCKLSNMFPDSVKSDGNISAFCHEESCVWMFDNHENLIVLKKEKP